MCACSNHLKVNAGKHFQKTDMSVFRNKESFIQMKEISCAYGKTPAFFFVFCISIHSSSFPVFGVLFFFFRFIPLFPFQDPKTSQNKHILSAIFCTKSLPFQISNLGSQSWFIQEGSKWTVLSGQLFIQFRCTPWLNKVRGSFFLCWFSPIYLLKKVF